MSEFRSHRDNERVLVEMWTVEAVDGDHAAAILLSQLLWWFQPAKGTTSPRVRYERLGENWLIRSDDGWWEDCRLTTKQVRRIRGVLAARGFIIHKRFKVNGAPTGAWRPDIPVLERFIAEYEANRPNGQLTDSELPNRANGTDPTGQVPIDTDLSHTPDSPKTSVDDVDVVFAAWTEATGRTRAKLTDDRRGRIVRWLRVYSVAELVDAVRGWRWSPHHCGQNDRGTVYNDLELLLRDAKRIEQFRDWEQGIGRPVPARPSGNGKTVTTTNGHRVSQSYANVANYFASKRANNGGNE